MGPLRAVPTLLLRTEVGMGWLVAGLNAGTHLNVTQEQACETNATGSDALGRVWLRLLSHAILVEVSY